MKKLSLENGVVLAHPFELAELVQNYGASNIQELISFLFTSYGVINPSGGDLEVRSQDSTIFIAPGKAICGKGILDVESGVKISMEGMIPDAIAGKFWVNLHHLYQESAPVNLYPYGVATGNLLVEDSYEILIESSPVSLELGVPLATVTPKVFGQDTPLAVKRGYTSLLVTDLRGEYSAEFSPTHLLKVEGLDPLLVPEVEKVFSREGVAEELIDLLENKVLQGEMVVTRPGPIAQPVFLEMNHEPTYRHLVRTWHSGKSKIPPPIDATWRWTGEWNLHGVFAKQEDNQDETGFARFGVSTVHNLTNLNIDALPLYIRYGGENYEIGEVEDGNIVVATEAPQVGAPDEDPRASIHNGGNQFFLIGTSLEGISSGTENSFCFDDQDGNGTSGALSLSPGSYQISIQSIGDNSRGIYSFPYTLPKFPFPPIGHSVTLSGEKRDSGTNESVYDGVPLEEGFQKANPFSKLAIGASGDPIIDTSQLDQYVNRFEEELKRIQEADISLVAEILPPPRSRSERSGTSSLVIGYDIVVEVFTRQGWKKTHSKRVFREMEALMEEISWLDVNSKAYRGEVDYPTSLQGYEMELEARPLRNDDLIWANDGNSEEQGLYRYEPSMKSGDTSGLTVIPSHISGDDSLGYWVLVADDLDSYQGETLTVEFLKIVGGSDYRARVRPLSETGLLGVEATESTTDLRDAYNATLGFNFHRTLTDMYRTSKMLLEQVDPNRIDAMIAERMNEIREIIDRAALYGNPPRIEGPFQIPATPPATTFVGTNLSGVKEVTMRYTPSSTDLEEVIPLNFRLVVAPGSESSIVITDLPNLSDLSTSSPPAITLEFNAGVRGKDLIVVSYVTVSPRVFGPNIGEFKGTRAVSLGTHLIENTASYYRSDTVSAETQPEGPYPKIWEDPSDVVHSDLETELGVSGIIAAPWISPSSMRTLQFSVKNFTYESILDLRIKQIPTDLVVKGIWYGEDGVIDDKLADLQSTKTPVYQQLLYSSNECLLVVHKDLLPKWEGRNFVLEYIYYDGTPVVGKNDCRGLIISNFGSLSSVPSGTPQDGWYYFNTTTDLHMVYDGGWEEATPLGQGRHSFSIASFQTPGTKQKQVNMGLFAGALYAGPDKHPEYGYDIVQPYSALVDIYDKNVGDITTEIMELTLRLGDNTTTGLSDVDMNSSFSATYTWDDHRSIEIQFPETLTGLTRLSDSATGISIDLDSFYILVNGSLVSTIAAPVGGLYEFSLRDYMVEGGGVTMEIIPIYS